MIKNIIFDIGNVLTDFRWEDFLRDKGFDEEMIKRIAEACVYSDVWKEYDKGIWTDEEILEGFAQNDPEIRDEIYRAFSDFTDLVTPRDYAIPWVKELKEKGYKVWYLSNFSNKATTECAECLSFIPYTDGGILSFRDKVIKPDATIYELLLDRFGLVAEESVFIDDTLVNVEAAEALGIYGIHFISKEETEDKLRELGVK